MAQPSQQVNVALFISVCSSDEAESLVASSPPPSPGSADSDSARSAGSAVCPFWEGEAGEPTTPLQSPLQTPPIVLKPVFDRTPLPASPPLPSKSASAASIFDASPFPSRFPSSSFPSPLPSPLHTPSFAHVAAPTFDVSPFPSKLFPSPLPSPLYTPSCLAVPGGLVEPTGGDRGKFGAKFGGFVPIEPDSPRLGFSPEVGLATSLPKTRLLGASRHTQPQWWLLETEAMGLKMPSPKRVLVGGVGGRT